MDLTARTTTLAIRLVRAAAGVFGRLAIFARSCGASAAVEFAIVLPVALVLYMGAAQVSDGVMASRKVNTVTRTVVDLLSQQPTSFGLVSTPTPSNAVTASTLQSLFTGVAVLLYPEPTSTLQLTLTAIDIRNGPLGLCCVATVRWSYTQGGTLRPCGVSLQPGSDPAVITSVPSGLMPYGVILPTPLSLLVTDVAYTYQPVIKSSLMSFMPTMRRTEYIMPRTSGQVITAPLPTSGPQVGKICY